MSRKFTDSGWLAGGKLLAAIAILLWAGACAPVAGDLSLGDAGRQSIVAWKVSQHEVRFEPGKELLAAGEAARLEAFLGAFDLRRPMHIFVGAETQNGDSRLAQRRRATAHELLANYGVTARREPPPAEPGKALHSRPSGADRAVILAGRFEVEVIGCPDWRKPVLDDFTNYESSNFGCANANNLALMVADPMDLVGGRDGGAGDGTRAAGTVRKYRSGALPSLGDTGSSFVSIPPAAGGVN